MLLQTSGVLGGSAQAAASCTHCVHIVTYSAQTMPTLCKQFAYMACMPATVMSLKGEEHSGVA